MSAKSLEQLKEQYPGRLTLRADEVALILRGKNTRNVVARIRTGMKQGRYGEGARQIDGLWQLPLEDLAEVIEPTPKSPAHLPPVFAPDTKPRKRRRGTLGERLAFVHQSLFWADVFQGMGDMRHAQRLRGLADKVHGDLQVQAQEKKAQKTKRDLLEHVDQTLKAKPHQESPKKKL